MPNSNQIAIELVGLNRLMERTAGRPEVLIGVIDGPVATNLPHFTSGNLATHVSASCARTSSAACTHGTLVVGVLAAKRGSGAPSICPNCSFVLRGIFEEIDAHGDVPRAPAGELTSAIHEMLAANVYVINMSVALARPSAKDEQGLRGALDSAAGRGVIVVAAAGNQGTLGSTAITRHPWVIPVAACDVQARMTMESNLGGSIGTRGLRAPGQNIVSITPEGETLAFGGTSAATPFVTGTIGLLASVFPLVAPSRVRYALLSSGMGTRRTVVPPLLNAWAAHQRLVA